jgi:DNA-binding transcriptional regulator YiaG
MIITTTTNPPAILSDAGEPMPTSEGIREIRRRLGISAADLASSCGVSRRTVEGWEQGRPVSKAPMLLMAGLLEQAKG